MRVRAICVVMLALLVSACGYAQTGVPGSQQQAGSQQGEITIRKNVNLINVYFSVKDRHGALVPNLAKDTFEIFENGRPQTIKYFAAETDLPLTLGLLIDSSGSMQRMLPEEKVVAADFLRQVVGEKDLAFVISFDISVDLLQDLTSDIRLLRAGLDKARINVGGGSGGIPGLGQGPVPISHPKGTLLFDGVYLSAHEILQQQVGRKAMVILTDGEDVGSRLKLRDAIEAAQKADAICYVLLLSDPQYGSNARDMGQLAEQTGGRLISIQRPDKIGDAFRQISAELRSQYSLGYSSDDSKHDGSFRKIEIKSKDGLKVQARKGYYALTN
ncbi:MAG TPA: VWA domain-containing protein [Candidatus Saccharimonadales bacterium]|jgi:VWFA-related protein|nr:VWA domain-containing protein [Candidatus Saccharimonadales bacterium]